MNVLFKSQGHGGMDFIMDYRLIYCLVNGLPLDQDVYDAAEWSSIIELSKRSVENQSMPVKIPDFTRGAWQKVDKVTYYKKFDELSPGDDAANVKPSPDEIKKGLQEISLLNEPVAVEFLTLIVELWNGEGIEQLISMIILIRTGKLKPNFEIPEDPEELAQWLDISLEDDVVRRHIRFKLRAIAKDNGEIYRSENLIRKNLDVNFQT